MGDLDRVLVFLRSNNDIDNVIPIVYKLGESTTIPVEIVFHNSSIMDDFRVDFVRQYENIRVNLVNFSTGSVISDFVPSTPDRTGSKTYVVETLKQIGRDLPTTIPEQLYQKVVGTSSQEGIAEILTQLTNRSENVLLVFDYFPGKTTNGYREMIQEAKKRGQTTIAVPHAGGGTINSLLRPKKIDQFIDEGAFETLDTVPSALYFRAHERMDILDYVTIPNNLFRRRFDFFMDDDRMKLTGSARYCLEWVNILQNIAPKNKCPSTDTEYTVVMFIGRTSRFLTQENIRLTVDLISSLPNISVAIKNHPREKFITDKSDLRYSENVLLVDDINSPYLLDWGDIFVDTGTSVTVDCIMRKKPLLVLDYLHANRSAIVEYLPECEIQSYDDLYLTFVDLLSGNSLDTFYNESHRERFIQNVVTNGYNDVLQQHVDVFESVVE